MIAKKYLKNLENIKEIKCMPYSSKCSFFVFQIFCKNRDKLLKEFKKRLSKYSLCHPIATNLIIKRKYNFKKVIFQNAKTYADTNISLPVYPSLKLKELNKVVKVIKEFYGY